MARIHIITGDLTDNVAIEPTTRRAHVRHHGFGRVTAECRCHRIGQVTHAIVRFDTSGTGQAVPIEWLTDAPVPNATILPFSRRATHA